MTPDVITAKLDESLGQIAAFLEKNRIKRVPIVINENNCRYRQPRKPYSGAGQSGGKARKEIRRG